MTLKPENWLFSDPKFAAFSNLLLRTKAMNSIDFISELVKGIGDVLDADLVFVSRAVDMPVTRAMGIRLTE